jgi:hypothetical protein
MRGRWIATIARVLQRVPPRGDSSDVHKRISSKVIVPKPPFWGGYHTYAHPGLHRGDVDRSQRKNVKIEERKKHPGAK